VIRINLLPQTRRTKAAEPGQGWLVALMLLVVLEVIGCLVSYSFKQEELEDWGRKNSTLEGEIAISKEKVKNHPTVLAKLEVLRNRETAIAKLQSARTGPTAMLMEISRLMTRGRGPSVSPEELEKVRSENPLAMFNTSWDSRRLWLESFVEEARTVQLVGTARDGEDVSELARRMNLSGYFYDVRLLPGKRQGDGEEAEYVDFRLEAKVRY